MRILTTPGSCDLSGPTSVAFHEVDEAGIIQRVNSALLSLLDYEAAQLVGRGIWEVAVEPDRDRVRERYSRPVSGHAPLRIEQRRFLTRGGSELCLEVHDAPLRDSSGQIVGTRSSVFDPRQLEERYRGLVRAIEDAGQHYRAMFNSVSDAVYVFTVSENGAPSLFLEVNDSACRHLGYTREELLRMRLPGILAPEIQLNWPHVLSDLTRRERGLYEGVEISKDGRRIPVEVHVQLTNLYGPRTLIASVRNVSDRKAAEKQYQDIFEGALEGIYRTSKEGRNLAANPALARMLGYQSGSEVVSTVHDSANQVWFDPEDRARFVDRLERDGLLMGYECRYRRKDGSPIWVSLNSRKVCDKDGNTLYFQGFIEDITERRRMQDALRKSEEKFSKAFMGSPAITMLCDLDDAGRLILVNSAFEEVYGYLSGEVIGRTAEELGLWADPAEYAEAMRQVREKGRLRSFEFRFRRKDGSAGVGSASAELIELDGKACAILATIDVTEMQRAEARRAELEKQFQQSQKMESIGRLAGGVAHDFNNLLTVINGYSGMLLARLGEGDPMRTQLEEIRRAGERAAGMTQQLLAFSRKQVLQARRLNVNRVLQEMQPLLERLIGDDIQVRMSLRAQGGTVYADPHQLEQVIMNLAVNGRDAMPRGGVLRVQTASVECGEGLPVVHPEGRAGQFLVVSVSDTGVGMDQETLSRICEPFFTTKPVGEGTGLGMSMVQGIVLQSGGCMRVNSKPGQGTRVDIYLPDLGGDDAAAVERPSAPGARRSETVLVVEDLAEVRTYVAAVLHSYGYRVLTAAGAGEAITLHERHPGRVDLVLTDVVMPQTGGPELAQQLRAVQPDIKVLFMSGFTGSSAADEELCTQGASFISKPFGPAELAAKVREMLGPPQQQPCVLVADDEAAVRGFLCEALAEAGYRTIAAPDGRQALHAARTERVDLIITDLVMPEQEGIETIQKLVQEMPHIGIIAISGGFGGQFLDIAQLMGADAALRKPVSVEVLLAKVAEVLQSRKRKRAAP